MGIGNRGTEIVRFSKIDNYNVFERLPRERERERERRHRCEDEKECSSVHKERE